MSKFLFICSMILLFASFIVEGFSRDLPESVTIKDLLEESSPFDDRRISVVGYIKEIEAKRGRLGSTFIEFTIQDFEGTISSGEIKVVADHRIFFRPGDRVRVQGIFKERGRFGGMLKDNFIICDAIIREH